MAVSRKRRSDNAQYMKDFFDDIYHPDQPICQLLPTSTEKKEDCFNLYRPKPNTCLDYSISQTDAKLDAGDTKIHVQQTTATYVPHENPPPPPRAKKRKYCSGTEPPVWEFLNEIWAREIKEKHKDRDKEQKMRKEARKKHEKASLLARHNELIRLVGPAWYQELSPQQTATVDKLNACILKDLSENTVIYTRDNIRELGVVPPVRKVHLKTALANCCKCAVEFLLILYQLIDPERRKYSINDRLLLSAVVHLTMQNTLQELHIRIPSPPPKPCPAAKKPTKTKKIKYESPYLEPFTFVRSPPKFSGVYVNKHVQRPQSRYFCYLAELKRMKEQANENGNGHGTSQVKIKNVDEEIEEELQLAQEKYENLVDFQPVPTLLKPSKYIGCNKFVHGDFAPAKYKELYEELEEEEEEEEEIAPCFDVEYKDICTEIEDIPPDVCCCCTFETSQDLEEEEEAEVMESCCVAETSCKCCANIEEEDKECEECQIEETEETVECHQTNNPLISCSCGKKLEKKRKEFLKELEQAKCQHERDLMIYNKMYSLIRPGAYEIEKCKCKENFQKFIQTPPCQCERCVEDRRRDSINLIIRGLAEPTGEETVAVIEGLAEEKPCKCLQQYEERIEKFEEERERKRKRLCDCHEKIKEKVEESYCQCEKCVEDRRIAASKFIIQGTAERDDEEIRVIEGTSTGRPCDCVQQYEKRVEKYEAFDKRKKVVVALKEQDDKFQIGGIVETDKGPVYVITGLRPPIDCACAKKFREDRDEAHMKAIMPKLPPSRFQYKIAGVKETPDGNVFILDNTLPAEDCVCMDVYEKFEEEHMTCNQLFDQFLIHIKEEYNEFMNEMLPSSALGSRQPSMNLNPPLQEEEGKAFAMLEDLVENQNEEQIPEVQEETIEKEEVLSEKCASSPEVVESFSKQSAQPLCRCDEVVPDTCAQCLCGVEPVECVDCDCMPPKEPSVVEEEIEVPKPLKRFFIYSKIKCNRRWQLKVLKKSLESMALDGFPLAKLPECYKLPHFELWMQMRCGMFWTMQDRYKSIYTSRMQWNHTDQCEVRRTEFPVIEVSRKEAHNLDWSRVRYCKKMIKDAIDKFYRRIKHNEINFGREFFPTTMTYRFPFPGWRECYFAYTPSKEQEVNARFVWQKHHFKNYADMQRFCH